MTLVRDLAALGFDRCGAIEETTAGRKEPRLRLRFRLAKPASEGTGVYAWVQEGPEPRRRVLLYIGKAGSTLAARCRQHHRGFDGDSRRGLRHAADLRGVLAQGAAIGVWFRPSETRRFFDVDVSLAHVEEIALIKRLRPRWNDTGRDPDAVQNGIGS